MLLYFISVQFVIRVVVSREGDEDGVKPIKIRIFAVARSRIVARQA